MSETDIRRLDMTLLLVFASLLRSGQATATAHELGVTQSSVSHSLAKLRDIFGDELFVRKLNGLQPTARALALQPQIDDILRLARNAVREGPFDPYSAQRLVRIAGTDYPCTLLAAPLLERLERDAPNVRVSFRPFIRQRALEALRSGELDFAIGPFGDGDGELDRRVLWQDDYWVAARKGHPTFRSACGLSDYIKARHVLISLNGDLSGIVDSALARRNLSRQVVAAAPYFLTGLSIVSCSDAVATMPGSIARAHAAQLGLKLFPCPIAIRPLTVSLISHSRTQGDPFTAWFAELVASVSSSKAGPNKRRRAKR